MSSLKFWRAYCCERVHDDHFYASLIAAPDAETAADLAWERDGDLRDICDEDRDLMEVEQVTLTIKADQILDLPVKPGIVLDRAVLRAAGFECEFDRRCDCCGMAEMDGEWSVCDSCHLCCDCRAEGECADAGAGCSYE